MRAERGIEEVSAAGGEEKAVRSARALCLALHDCRYRSIPVPYSYPVITSDSCVPPPLDFPRGGNHVPCRKKTLARGACPALRCYAECCAVAFVR